MKGLQGRARGVLVERRPTPPDRDTPTQRAVDPPEQRKGSTAQFPQHPSTKFRDCWSAFHRVNGGSLPGGYLTECTAVVHSPETLQHKVTCPPNGGKAVGLTRWEGNRSEQRPHEGYVLILPRAEANQLDARQGHVINDLSQEPGAEWIELPVTEVIAPDTVARRRPQRLPGCRGAEVEYDVHGSRRQRRRRGCQLAPAGGIAERPRQPGYTGQEVIARNPLERIGMYLIARLDERSVS